MSHAALVRRRICLRGIVQGVGFRPFVYNLARTLGIRGFVLNSTAGVIIEAEGDPAALDEFQQSVCTHPPPLARIDQIATANLDPAGDQGFEIRQSDAQPGDFVLVSPDVAMSPPGKKMGVTTKESVVKARREPLISSTA